MKMRFTLLAAAAAMLLTAQAETLTLQMGHGEGATILNNGRFNPNGMFIGNTSTDTQIEIGEVDFGSGDLYQAVSVRFANGWSNGGALILSAGETIDEAVPFAQIDLINFHDSYTNFRSIGANIESPTGVQKVFMTFVERAGNIMDVRFYEEAFTEDSFESGSMLKEPNQMADYNGTIMPIDGAELIYSPSADTRIDNGSWGWTQEGVVVKYGTLDFGDDGFDQVILGVASHWDGDKAADNIDVYIDDYENADNLLATVWTGIEIRNGKIYLARNIEKVVTGEHIVYLLWHGGSTNVAEVEFCKGQLWSIGNRVDPVATEVIDETPSDKADRYSFLASMQNSEDAVYIGRNSDRTTILNRGQWEDDNVGYTGDGTVLKITGIDFKEGQFDKILVSHSTGMSGAAYTDYSNFKFYLDLEDAPTTADGAPMRLVVDDWANVRDQLTGIDPVATVKLQPTAGWGNVKTTIGDLSKVEGVHDVYVIYTAADGANVKDIYLDDQEEDEPVSTGVTTVTAVKAVNNNVYTIDGRLVRKNATSLEGLASGLYIFNGQKYIVK